MIDRIKFFLYLFSIEKSFEYGRFLIEKTVKENKEKIPETFFICFDVELFYTSEDFLGKKFQLEFSRYSKKVRYKEYKR